MVEDILFIRNYSADSTLSEMLLRPDDFSTIPEDEKRKLEEFVNELIALLKKAVKEWRLYGKMSPEQYVCDLRVIDKGVFAVYVDFSYYRKMKMDCCFSRNDEIVYWNEIDYVNYILERKKEGIRFEIGSIKKYPISYKVIVTRSAPFNRHN